MSFNNETIFFVSQYKGMAKKKTSAKQRAQQAEFKRRIKMAKEIQRKHPNKKWSTCVKEAWKK